MNVETLTGTTVKLTHGETYYEFHGIIITHAHYYFQNTSNITLAHSHHNQHIHTHY